MHNGTGGQHGWRLLVPNQACSKQVSGISTLEVFTLYVGLPEENTMRGTHSSTSSRMNSNAPCRIKCHYQSKVTDEPLSALN